MKINILSITGVQVDAILVMVHVRYVERAHACVLRVLWVVCACMCIVWALYGRVKCGICIPIYSCGQILKALIHSPRKLSPAPAPTLALRSTSSSTSSSASNSTSSSTSTSTSSFTSIALYQTLRRTLRSVPALQLALSNLFSLSLSSPLSNSSSLSRSLSLALSSSEIVGSYRARRIPQNPLERTFSRI